MCELASKLCDYPDLSSTKETERVFKNPWFTAIMLLSCLLLLSALDRHKFFQMAKTVVLTFHSQLEVTHINHYKLSRLKGWDTPSWPSLWMTIICRLLCVRQQRHMSALVCLNKALFGVNVEMELLYILQGLSQYCCCPNKGWRQCFFTW